jgi:hypothetical protein
VTKSSIRDQPLIEARVQDMVDRLAEALDLGWLKITLKFDPRNLDTDRVLCEALSDWEYRQVSFLFNLHQLASTPDEELQDTIVHELVHALNSPIWSSLTNKQQDRHAKLNELATENCARVINHLLSKGNI